jgi:hypothetical protein
MCRAIETYLDCEEKEEPGWFVRFLENRGDE